MVSSKTPQVESKTFTNEFVVKREVKELEAFETGYDKSLSTGKKFGYKVAGQLSRKLTEEMKVSMACLGSLLITEPGVKIPKLVTLTMKIEGVPTDVEITVSRAGLIKPKDSNFKEAVKKYLNRCIDWLMVSQGFIQDGRGYYETKSKDIGRFYTVYQGIFVTTLVPKSQGEPWTVVVDPLNQIRAKMNLLQVLNDELKRRGLKHWKEAEPYSDEINKSLRSRAYTLRSTYREPRLDGDPEHNIYKFVGFNFSKGLQESSDPRSPANFHRKFGRPFTMDQPEVEVIAEGGFKITQIPSLLEELPSMHMLKRFGVSEKIQARSLMGATDRYYMTTELVKPLVDQNFIEPKPLTVEAKDYGPVRLTVEGDYLELKSNYDFQKYFKKKKVLRKPKLKKIHVFSTKMDAKLAKKLVQLMTKTFEEFKLPLPEVKEHLDCPATLDGFRAYVLEVASKNNFSAQDLCLVVLGFRDEDLESVTYTSLKKESFKRLFPVQFVNSQTLEEEEGKDLKKDVVNPLFLQIVAKGGGQPYGLQPGFAPIGTLFVGIDRYRDPFRKDAPLVTSIVFFDNHGNYVCSKSVVSKKAQTEGAYQDLYSLLKEGFEQFCAVTSIHRWSLALFLEDTGRGTMEEQLRTEADECQKAAAEIGADFAFLTANKSSHLRLYQGNPSDPVSAKKVSPFTAAISMKDPSEFLVVSTEPMVSREAAKEYGTQRPILYSIFSHGSEFIEKLRGLKETSAKSIVWLCRHSWVSPTSTRLPAPLYFANNLSRLVSATEVEVSPDQMKAPLFL